MLEPPPYTDPRAVGRFSFARGYGFRVLYDSSTAETGSECYRLVEDSIADGHGEAHARVFMFTATGRIVSQYV